MLYLNAQQIKDIIALMYDNGLVKPADAMDAILQYQQVAKTIYDFNYSAQTSIPIYIDEFGQLSKEPTDNALALIQNHDTVSIMLSRGDRVKPLGSFTGDQTELKFDELGSAIGTETTLPLSNTLEKTKGRITEMQKMLFSRFNSTARGPAYDSIEKMISTLLSAAETGDIPKQLAKSASMRQAKLMQTEENYYNRATSRLFKKAKPSLIPYHDLLINFAIQLFNTLPDNQKDELNRLINEMNAAEAKLLGTRKELTKALTSQEYERIITAFLQEEAIDDVMTLENIIQQLAGLDENASHAEIEHHHVPTLEATSLFKMTKIYLNQLKQYYELNQEIALQAAAISKLMQQIKDIANNPAALKELTTFLESTSKQLDSFYKPFEDALTYLMNKELLPISNAYKKRVNITTHLKYLDKLTASIERTSKKETLAKQHNEVVKTLEAFTKIKPTLIELRDQAESLLSKIITQWEKAFPDDLIALQKKELGNALSLLESARKNAIPEELAKAETHFLTLFAMIYQRNNHYQNTLLNLLERTQKVIEQIDNAFAAEKALQQRFPETATLTTSSEEHALPSSSYGGRKGPKELPSERTIGSDSRKEVKIGGDTPGGSKKFGA